MRNHPHEAPISLAPDRIDEYGFVFARESIAVALSSPEADRAMRDFMVRVGLARSPILAQIDAEIAAQERQLTASRRAFWVPSLSLGAGVNHLAARDSAGGSTSDLNETEWGVSAGLSFPVFAGGAKFAGHRQSRDTLSSLRIQRRSEGQTIGESIGVAFAQVSGSYASLGYAREQEASSKKNFDLVNQSYVAGVSSILDLLDAQTQLLDAQIGVANATYGFLEDLMAAEQEIAFFPFLEPESEVAELLDGLERQLRDQP